MYDKTGGKQMSKKNYEDLVPEDFNEALSKADFAEEVQKPEVASVEKITNPVQPKPPVVYVKVIGCDKLRVREEPSTNARTLALINKGSKLILKEKVNDTWSKIQTLAGINGYVMNKYIKK